MNLKYYLVQIPNRGAGNVKGKRLVFPKSRPRFKSDRLDMAFFGLIEVGIVRLW